MKKPWIVIVVVVLMGAGAAFADGGLTLPPVPEVPCGSSGTIGLPPLPTGG